MSKTMTGNRMELFFNRLLFSTIVINLFIAIIGIIMFVNPSLSTRVIGILTGITFVINGIGVGYRFFKRDGAKLYTFNLLFALISIVLGAVLIIYPFSVMEFAVVCLGIYLINIGILNINYGVWFKIGNDDAWLLTLVIGILLIIFGILVIVNPFSSLKLTQVIGLFLMIVSILQITDAILLKKRAQEIVKIFW